ncbi:heme-binding protein 2-like [Rhodamnia argentea]|uniref:Heme-binding protein 2-like n=1 Tax=Rhodamnia argentea TaxID=178133 RepID=A0A8B8NAK7_9MYRT|nr:heme-binding protein 2-like [Rhodamnia argentea]
MKRSSSMLILFLFLLIIIPCDHAIESPQYTVALLATDFEIRHYRNSTWMSAALQGTSFEKSTQEGFHRLYRFIRGENLNSSEIDMTSPIVTGIAQSSQGSFRSYWVSFYLPAKFQGVPPQPDPELNLKLDEQKAHCVAVRKFAGFARDDNIDGEMEALVASLDNYTSGRIAMDDKNEFAVAQYNASHHLSGRLNEIWLDVGTPVADKCQP